jgi:hypothetical protein
LAASLEANWRAEAKLAQREHGMPDAVAGLPGQVPAERQPAPSPMTPRRNDATPFN